MKNTTLFEEKREEPMHWFAMSAPFRREIKVKEMLEKEKMECFIPMRQDIRTVKGKKEVVSVPAVSNLIFVHTTDSRLKWFKTYTTYLQYLTWTIDGISHKIIIPDYQMNQFMAVCNTHDKKLIFLKPYEVNLSKGVHVRIHGGTFDNVEGIFVKVKGARSKRVVVLLPNTMAVATAEVHPDLLEILSDPEPRPSVK